MREIKFRGKDCSGQWVYGDLIHKRHDKESVLIQDYKGLGSDVDTITIGQYTGLIDKTGKEIYEGDVLRIKEYENDGYRTFGSDESFDCLTIDECKGKLLREGNELVCFTDGCMSVGDTMYISSLFGDMRYSFPIFEFEVIGNIYDNPELIKEEKK